jgi:hypothetical protein
LLTATGSLPCDLARKHRADPQRASRRGTALSLVDRLGDCLCAGAAALGIDSIVRSKGLIPNAFLRGVGLPDELIAYIPSLVGDGIQRGIYSWDKVLLCASKNSLTSTWVEREIKTTLAKEEALRKEREKLVLKLIPLDLDGFMSTVQWDLGVLANEIRGRVAADFRDWETNEAKFNDQVNRVIRALRADEGAIEPPPPSKL